MSKVCNRCGAVEWEGRNCMELSMPNFSIPHTRARGWVDHVMQAMADEDLSSNSILLAYYLANNACYHWEPQMQGYIALKAKRNAKEMGIWGIGYGMLAQAVTELSGHDIVEYTAKGSEISHVSFTDEFLQPEIEGYLEDCREAEKRARFGEDEITE